MLETPRDSTFPNEFSLIKMQDDLDNMQNLSIIAQDMAKISQKKLPFLRK